MSESKVDILIYVPDITNRIRFVFRFVFEEFLGVSYEVTKDVEQFEQSESFRLNYSKNQDLPGVFLEAKDLLFERDINSQEIKMLEFNAVPAFFPVYSSASILPFDMFAAIFYLLSRYEEYLPYRKDAHGRFPACESLAYQKNFLHIPVVDRWLVAFGAMLHDVDENFIPKKRNFSFLPTINVDVAYAYRLRGLIRFVGACVKDLLGFDFRSVIQRFVVVLGFDKDPYDTYDDILALHRKYNLKSLFFILLGAYSEYDKNISGKMGEMRVLVKHLGDYSKVGIHPSYGSNEHPEQLRVEVKMLEDILHREVNDSRHHFLKIHLPINYRRLLKLGIRHDYSMGYTEEIGFRAGTANSFNFYDLDFDSETKLRLHPFAVMDKTLRDFLMLNEAEAFDAVKKIIDEIIAVQGNFISIWHNESLSDHKHYTGWRNVYVRMIDYATKAI